MTSCKNCSLWLWVPACAGTTSGEWHRGNRLRGTTRECLHSRGANAPEVCENSPPFPWEGRGECRVPTHPQPRMQNKKAYELVTTGRPDDPAFPHAMVLTVSFVISPVIGLCCHRRFACAKLDASVEASGPHDFAVRVQHRSSKVPNSVHRIPSRVRDDRERPSVGRDSAIRKVFCLWGETKYFREQGWTGQISLIAFEKIAGTRISETASFMACCLLGFRKRQ